MEVISILSIVYYFIDKRVIGKEADVWAYVIANIVYEEQKQDGTEHWH